MTDMQVITTHPAEAVEAGQLESLTLHTRILEFAHETGVDVWGILRRRKWIVMR